MPTFNLSLQAAQFLYQRATNNSSAEEWKEIHSALKKVCEVVSDWKKTPSGVSDYISGLGWRVSFQENPSDSEEPETALFNTENNKCYMLSGDHRKEYHMAAKGGWDSLFAVYLSKREEFYHSSDDF